MCKKAARDLCINLSSTPNALSEASLDLNLHLNFFTPNGLGDTTRQVSPTDGPLVRLTVPMGEVSHTGHHLHRVPRGDVPATGRAHAGSGCHELARLPLLVGPLRVVRVEILGWHWSQDADIDVQTEIEPTGLSHHNVSTTNFARRSPMHPARTIPDVSDYEWLVELGAKGLAERDNHPMPESITTPEAFYEVMARAAFDAIGLPALIEDMARAERELNVTNEALTQADAKAENARHWRRRARLSPDSHPAAT